MGFPRAAATTFCAALLSACGSGGSGSTPGTQRPADPPPGYAYVTLVIAGGASPNGRVLQYSVGADGSLAPMPVAMVAAGNTPEAIAVDPQGRYAYVVNAGDGSISQFSLGGGGNLMPLSPAQVADPGMQTLLGNTAIAVDPSGRFVYVTNASDSNVSQFTIGTDGSLTPMSPATVAVGENPGMVAIDAGSRHAYIPNSGFGATPGNVSQFTIGSAGGLVPLNPAEIAAGAGPTAVTIAPDGTFVFIVSNCNGNQCVGEILPYAIGTDGALSATGTAVQTGAHYDGVGMLIDSSQSAAYLLTNLMGVDTNAGAVWQYSVGGGALSPGIPSNVALTTQSVAEALLGTNLFVLNLNSSQAFGSDAGNVQRYVIGGGGLALAATTVIGSGLPTSMAVVPVP